MDFVLEHLIPLVELLAPVLAGVISVPLFNLVKKAVSWIDGQAGWLQQILVAVQTYVLAELSALAGVVLPETLAGVTLDNTEALAAAGIAFAIHAGKKAAGGNVAGAAALILAFLVLPSPASAQVTDSIQIQVNSPPVAIDLGQCESGTFSGQAYVGSPIDCVLTALDSNSDPTVATFSAESSDSAVAVPSMVNDSTLRINFNAPGSVVIYVTANEVTVAMGQMNEPWDSTASFAMASETSGFQMEVGDTVRVCGYLFETALVDGTWRTFPTARSHQMCPQGAVGAPAELPVITFEFESSDTTVVRFIPDEVTQQAAVPAGGWPAPQSIRMKNAA